MQTLCTHREMTPHRQRTLVLWMLIAIVLFAVSPTAHAEFAVALDTEVETRPAVAFNSQTGEFFVAYLERQSDILGNPVELRVRRFNSDGVQQGDVLQPLGSGSHEALGRPAIAYSTAENIMLVTVPVRNNTSADRVLARFLAADGTSLVGPDFLFDTTIGFYDDGQITDGNGSLQVTYNSILDEFLVTVQRTLAGNNGVWAQTLSRTGGVGPVVLLNNNGIHGQKSHDIEYAALDTTPPGGRYLFFDSGFIGAFRVLDANLGTVTSLSFDWGEPQGNTTHHNISVGRIEGKDRWLIVWADGDNCRPGLVTCPNVLDQWAGVWGSFIDPANPQTGNNTPFPISKIWEHVAVETLFTPRVGYNRDAETFYVTWRDVPVLNPSNDESRSHIRGNRIDYFVPDGLAGALVPLPYDNVVLSPVSGTCSPSVPCFSNEDPMFPDVASNDGFNAVAVWQEKYVPNPGDLDIYGGILSPPIPDNDLRASPFFIAPSDPSLEVTLVGAFNDGSANCGQSASEPDVWFVYEAPAPGTFFINTCGTNDLYGQDTGMDTVLSLHRADGSQLGGVSCSDDWPASQPGACAAVDVAASRDSALAYPVAGGEEIFVRVSRFGTSHGGRFVLNHDFEPDPDADGDSIPDSLDNCVLKANAAQRDTDGDSIGNFCDPDIAQPNDCIVNVSDLGVFKLAFFSVPGAANWNADADFNGDNAVNIVDLGILKSQFFQAPGPSGLPNACGPV